MLYKLTYKEYY
ncbi:hypothetical protein VTH06DRAFT_2827 [Thermothelomyces fergusii]